MSSTWVDFKALRQQLRFADVLKSFNVELKMKGERATGFCPLPGHDGQRRSPSFSVNLARGIFQCFGCGAKGNVLDFACRMQGLNPDDPAEFRKSVLKLQEQFNLEAQRPPARASKSEQTPECTAAETRGGSDEGRCAKADEVPASMPADQQAEARGKPANEKTALAVLGPVVVNVPLEFELQGLDSNHPYLKERGFTAETIEHFGLGYCGRGLMKGRIAIPLHNAQGWLIGYAGRLVDDAAVNENNPKYRFPGERKREGVVYTFRKSVLLYNHFGISPPVTDLIVVEGFASVWWLWQQGRANVVAVMGAACSAEQAQLIVDSVKPAGRVWILSDGDEAGVRCAHSILTQVAASRLCRWLKLNQGVQPTDMTPVQLAVLLEEKRPVHEHISRFEFPGLFGHPAACGLERMDLEDGRAVIIATELADNPGVSITNFAEELATIVCRQFGIDPNNLVWIEHYPADRYRKADTFDLVHFLTDNRSTACTRLIEPKWRPMRESDWRELGLNSALFFCS